MTSLKRELLKLLTLFIGLLVLLFSSLMYLNLEFGIETDTRNTMLYQAKLVERAVLQDSVFPQLINSEILSVYTSFSELPEYIQQGFNWQNMDTSEMEQAYLVDDSGNEKYVYAMQYALSNRSETIYITSSYEESIEQAIEYEASISQGNSEYIITGVGLMLLTFFAFVCVLYVRLLKPLQYLLHWLKQDSNQFSYGELKFKELCSLVDEVAMNRARVKESVERETYFLNTLSHELRTPITIISSSGELLERVTKGNDAAQRATHRIMYSVKNMNLLVRTLLWVARKSDAELELSRVNLVNIVQEVLVNNSYLLADKELEIEVEHTEDCNELLESYGTIQLVLENLIRNAIQHSEQGLIGISVRASSVRVSNTTTFTTSDTESNGIGLHLVEKICQNRNYQFEFSTSEQIAVAFVNFRPFDNQLIT